MTDRPRVSVIIPALEEAANLTLVLPRLPAEYEVLVVDGNSADDTVAVARSLRPDVVIVQQTRRGKGNALACGLVAATGDVVVTFDADHSVDAGEIPLLVQALEAGADLAQGSRHVTGGCSAHGSGRQGTWGATAVAHLMTAALGGLATDPGYGFRAFWRDLLPVLDLPDAGTRPVTGEAVWGDGPEIDALITCRFLAAGARVVEVASRERPRAFSGGRPRSGSAGLHVLRTVLTEQRRVRLSRSAPTRRASPRATTGRAAARPR